MTLQEIFISNLKYFRKQKKITQTELTILIDKSYNYINGIEQSKYFPQPDVIEKIAKALEVEPYQLFKKDLTPSCIEDSFSKKYSTSIHDLLSQKIQKTIDEVCELVKC